MIILAGRTMFSDGEAESSILFRSSLTASSAIFSTGCSTAVMAGCTKVDSLVPDMHTMAISSGILMPCCCRTLLAPSACISVKQNNASHFPLGGGRIKVVIHCGFAVFLVAPCLDDQGRVYGMPCFFSVSQ